MTATMLPITLVTAGAAAIINLWLSLRVGMVRTSAKISIGDGGHDPLIRRMRAHANFVEYAPFILILIGLIEFAVGTSWWLWGASAVFLAARIAHPLGMDGLPLGRMFGAAATLLLLVALGGVAISLPFLAKPEKQILALSAVGAG